MDTDKMRRTLERNEDTYAWRRLATRKSPPAPRALRELALMMAGMRTRDATAGNRVRHAANDGSA